MPWTQDLSILLTIANIVLLAVLFLIYLKNYKGLKSNFTLGLLLFAGIFLLRDVGLAVYHMMDMGFYYTQSARGDIMIHSAQLVAFLILLKITWK